MGGYAQWGLAFTYDRYGNLLPGTIHGGFGGNYLRLGQRFNKSSHRHLRGQPAYQLQL